MWGGYLAHAGVKGMKWGHRKQAPTSGGTNYRTTSRPSTAQPSMYSRYVQLQNRQRAIQYSQNQRDPKWQRDQRIMQGKATVEDYKSRHFDLALDQASKLAVNAGLAYASKRYNLKLPAQGLGAAGMNAFMNSREKKKMKLS